MKCKENHLKQISTSSYRTPLLVTESVWTTFFEPLAVQREVLAKQVSKFSDGLDEAIRRWFQSNQSEGPLPVFVEHTDADGKTAAEQVVAIANIPHDSGMSSVLFAMPLEAEEIVRQHSAQGFGPYQIVDGHVLQGDI